MKPNDILEKLVDKIVPINNPKNFSTGYFYGYARGGYDVDAEKAKPYIDFNSIEPGSELESMLTHNIAFSTELILLLQNYLYKVKPDKGESIPKIVQIAVELAACAAVRCGNKMIYSKPIPVRKEKPKKPHALKNSHWYHNVKTGEIHMFHEEDVPEGWEIGRGEKWLTEQKVYRQKLREQFDILHRNTDLLKSLIGAENLDLKDL